MSITFRPAERKEAQGHTIGDLVNAFVDQLERYGYEVDPRSVGVGGLSATNPEGLSVTIEFDERWARPNNAQGPYVDPTSPRVLDGIRRALESYEAARLIS